MSDIGWIIVLVFLFWGAPDNWDKLDIIIDKHYQSVLEVEND